MSISSDLSAHDIHRRLVRLHLGASANNFAMLEVIRHFGWTRLGLVGLEISIFDEVNLSFSRPVIFARREARGVSGKKA